MFRQLAFALMFSLLAAVPNAAVVASDWGADLARVFTDAKADLFLRYRFEMVEDDRPRLKPAYASTLRSALGLRSGEFAGVHGYAQLEDVAVLGSQTFNDGGSNRVTDRAVVADPEDFELNQAYLSFGAIPKTVLTVGRQQIAHRQAPLHRFVGDVPWRQNFQSYDAVRLVTLALPKTTLEYAYVWNVNRILGERNRLPDGADFRMDSHWLNVQYSGFAAAKLEAYAYLLDFTSAASARFSTATVGLRVAGDRIVFPKTKLSYAGEYAYQRSFRNNPFEIEAHYGLAEIGLGYAFGDWIEAVALKLSYEVLGGSGGVDAFQTPLATLHAFQGFADRFLVTPGDGIRDLHGTLSVKLFGGQLAAVYHHFMADRGAYDYGDEVDVVFERPVAERFLVGIKYANYQAADDAENQRRNAVGGQAFDVAKFWTYVQFSY